MLTGFHIGIGAPADSVPRDRLWIRDGRLVAGANPMVGSSYSQYDYFVLRIEAPDRRPDWPGLPGLLDFEGRFSAILAGAERDDAAKRAEMGKVWPSFTEALRASPFLTRYDAGQIANDVQTDIQKRLDALGSGNPFETRAWSTDVVEARPPAIIDFAEIPAYGDSKPETGEVALGRATF